MQKVCRMKSKENMKKALYNILDWLETERPQHIRTFWTCAFKETILNQYSTLRLLRNRLMDGTSRQAGGDQRDQFQGNDSVRTREHRPKSFRQVGELTPKQTFTNNRQTNNINTDRGGFTPPADHRQRA